MKEIRVSRAALTGDKKANLLITNKVYAGGAVECVATESLALKAHSFNYRAGTMNHRGRIARSLVLRAPEMTTAQSYSWAFSGADK